jgi:drug/metabolite transporter (DMT)-like permease
LTRHFSLKQTTRTLFFTVLALTAFAANSVICRMALSQKAIDPASFTGIRLISGALVLILLVSITNRKNNAAVKGSWWSGAILFLYAITFSFAYISLDTGTGALILFAAVQITMITYALITGKKMNLKEWLGVLMAFAGFIYLVFPGVTAPSLNGLLLMTLSGIGWGIYTLRGKGSANALQVNAYNFLRTLPLVGIMFLFSLKQIQVTNEGIILAILSGAVTSGVGYTIWYVALRGLTAVQASVVQLLVPVIAAAGGVIFLSEILNLRLILAAVLILGGIGLVVVAKKT